MRIRAARPGGLSSRLFPAGYWASLNCASRGASRPAFSPALPPREVECAFGGLCVYARGALRGARHEADSHDCEHVSLCAALRARGGAVLFNPRCVVINGRDQLTGTEALGARVDDWRAFDDLAELDAAARARSDADDDDDTDERRPRPRDGGRDEEQDRDQESPDDDSDDDDSDDDASEACVGSAVAPLRVEVVWQYYECGDAARQAELDFCAARHVQLADVAHALLEQLEHEASLKLVCPTTTATTTQRRARLEVANVNARLSFGAALAYADAHVAPGALCVIANADVHLDETFAATATNALRGRADAALKRRARIRAQFHAFWGAVCVCVCVCVCVPHAPLACLFSLSQNERGLRSAPRARSESERAGAGADATRGGRRALRRRRAPRRARRVGLRLRRACSQFGETSLA